MDACCNDDDEYSTATKQKKWDNKSCLACGTILPDKEIVKAKGATTSKLLEIKNNSLSLSEPEYVLIFNVFTSTRKEQKQCLEQLNTRLCQHCLIFCDFQYCNECDLIYNPPIHMIYMILKEEESISSCVLELESIFNSDLNSNNDDDKNNSPSSAQYGNGKYSNSNSDSNPETYITLPDFTKEQKLK
ncbi:hypothetical protein G9A89_021606 [Geosiphon pyriformis]|nr:hypothetical protein G9A89_021606 [Geosiphon pyriformis]